MTAPARCARRATRAASTTRSSAAPGSAGRACLTSRSEEACSTTCSSAVSIREMMRKFIDISPLRSLTTASERFDVVIVGGGVVGSSVAFHLAREQPSMRIAEAVGATASYSDADGALSAGGIRQQFSLRERQLSIYGIDFLRSDAARPRARGRRHARPAAARRTPRSARRDARAGGARRDTHAVPPLPGAGACSSRRRPAGPILCARTTPCSAPRARAGSSCSARRARRPASRGCAPKASTATRSRSARTARATRAGSTRGRSCAT